MNAIERALLARTDPNKVNVADLIKQLVETDAALERAQAAAEKRQRVNDELLLELAAKDAVIEELRQREGR